LAATQPCATCPRPPTAPPLYHPSPARYLLPTDIYRLLPGLLDHLSNTRTHEILWQGQRYIFRATNSFSRAPTRGVDGVDVVRVWTDGVEIPVLTITELIDHFDKCSTVTTSEPPPSCPKTAFLHVLDDRLLVVPWKPLRSFLKRTGISSFCQCLVGTNRLAVGFNYHGHREVESKYRVFVCTVHLPIATMVNGK
jgi:hypothetical protein